MKSYISHDDQTIHSIDHLTSSSISKMFDSVTNEKVILDHGDVSYTIWVTYSEIYNESIYDLLVTSSAKRKPLKLSFDQNKNIYVKGRWIVLVMVEYYNMSIF